MPKKMLRCFYRFLLAWLCLLGCLQAQEKTAQKELLWAADSSSGVPFVFQDAQGNLIGFEVDIIQAVARYLNLKPVFVGNSFEGLIPGLRRGLYDVVINGLTRPLTETPGVIFTNTYLLASGQLVVREDTTDIHTVDDLQDKKVGVYRNWKNGISLEPIPGMELRRYFYELNAYEDLQQGRIDGVFLDFPESVYYSTILDGLKMTGPPLGDLKYAMAVSENNPELVEKINTALDALFEDGTINEILSAWGLWNPKMDRWKGHYTPSEQALNFYEKTIISQKEKSKPTSRFKLYISFLPTFLKAALTTLEVSILAMVLALSLGLIVAITRVYGPKPLSALAGVMTEVLRGTPLLIQLYLIFYGLPHLGIKLPAFLAGTLGLGLNYMAYEAENYRAGLQAIPKGQMEAARALGMSHLQALCHVIVPQAIRVVIPPITNDFISLIKDSSLLSVITIVELTETYTQLANMHYDFLGLGIIFGAIYLLLGLPFVALARRFQRKGLRRLTSRIKRY